MTGKNIHWDELMDVDVPQLRVHGCGFSRRIDDWSSGGDIMSPFWCLWHVMGNGSWIESDSVRWDLEPKSIMLKPPQLIYSRYNCCPAPQLWLHFSLMRNYAFEASTPFKIALTPLLREQITALIDTYDAADGDERVLYYQASALLNNCFALHPLPLRVLPNALRLILQRIENEPASDLSNATLARLTNQSLSSFGRWFELHMHQPPATYVRQIRFQKASKLLIFSDLSIEQIAAELGYPNRHYFSRAFAQHSSCGPATFRKLHRR